MAPLKAILLAVTTLLGGTKCLLGKKIANTQFFSCCPLERLWAAPTFEAETNSAKADALAINMKACAFTFRGQFGLESSF